jgi:hypothetical protein
MASEWKVRLSCNGIEIVFEASAAVSESRSSTWDGYAITHLPTAILSYRYTSARKFGVQAKLISRTPAEASINAGYLDLIRSWILPDFGGTGATPPTCIFNAYGNSNIQNLPVIIDQYNWSFPEDVDYIFTGSHPMPVIGLLTFELQEIYSPLEITQQKWKMNEVASPDSNTLGFNQSVNRTLNSLGFASGTPSVAGLGTGFSGLANGSVPGDPSLGSISSLGSNPVSGAAGISNSPEIKSFAASVNSNPFVTGVSNDISSTPTAPFSQPSVTQGDAFGRSSFSVDSLITN